MVGRGRSTRAAHGFMDSWIRGLTVSPSSHPMYMCMYMSKPQDVPRGSIDLDAHPRSPAGRPNTRNSKHSASEEYEEEKGRARHSAFLLATAMPASHPAASFGGGREHRCRASSFKESICAEVDPLPGSVPLIDHAGSCYDGFHKALLSMMPCTVSSILADEWQVIFRPMR
jgi:hypothetical protein